VGGLLQPPARLLYQLGVSPDFITLLGLGVVALGAWRLSLGEFTQGALILVLGLPLDSLDGAVARLGGVFRPFGAFLDSTLDRYADALVLGALGVYYVRQDDVTFTIISLIALHGTQMVSYVRAKAEALSLECKIGLFTRVERSLTLLGAWLLSLFIGQAGIDFGIIVLALGTQVTALQRLAYVGRQLKKTTSRETT
jgi:CDP-diacylglycerol--glycerol-3-phosphate 3-phosphatidyltransferase